MHRRVPALSTFESVILESVIETRDTRTLVLDLGSHATYRAGQYVTIDPHQFAGLRAFVAYLEHVKGRREAPRAYSLSSAPNDPQVAMTIKEEIYEAGRTPYPPLLSGFLVHHLRAGEPIVVRGFAGNYTLPDDLADRSGHVLHLCAGSGSVANLSILKDSLQRHQQLRHTFVYSNRTWQDVIFRDLLERLGEQYPTRLRLIHRLTREPAPFPYGAHVAAGRITLDLLRPLLAEQPDSLVYVCGPGVTVRERRACAAQGATPAPRFIETMLAHLDALCVPRAQIKVESYG
jgi:ferredoxin-NADP reductase